MAFLAALICVFSFAKEPSSITVMSFNIRGSENNDGTNSWDFRFSPVGYMMDDILPDVVGMQEPSQSQLVFFKDNFSQYKWVGVGRNDGKKLGEFTCILYNSRHPGQAVLRLGGGSRLHCGLGRDQGQEVRQQFLYGEHPYRC